MATRFRVDTKTPPTRNIVPRTNRGDESLPVFGSSPFVAITFRTLAMNTASAVVVGAMVVVVVVVGPTVGSGAAIVTMTDCDAPIIDVRVLLFAKAIENESAALRVHMTEIPSATAELVAAIVHVVVEN